MPDKMTQFHGIQRMVLKTVLSYAWFSWRMSGSGEPFFPMSGFLSLRLKFSLKLGSLLFSALEKIASHTKQRLIV
jgi:hypothetical protein